MSLVKPILPLAAILIPVLCIPAERKSSDQSDLARVGAIVPVSVARENIRQVWAYADPNDGQHLIACGMLSLPLTDTVYGYVYSSSDGGATWRRTLLDDASRWVSEESCTYGQNGRAYFVDGQSDTSTGLPRHEWGRLQVFISDDHGMSWRPTGSREFVDWTMLAAVPADKDHAESLVIFGNATANKLGHWWDKRPIALVATDGAQNLSPPVSTPITFFATFGGSSVTLPDRIALFAVGATDPKYVDEKGQNRQLNLLAYRLSDRSLNVRAILRNKPGRTMGLPFIVRDTGGQFHGRLYAAWSETARADSDAQLWLATSDDNGYHWWSRNILSVADYRKRTGCPSDLFTAPPDVRIAVNRTDVMGVLWKEDAQDLLFAASFDGGHAFQPSQLIVRQPMGELSLDEAVPFNEWWLGETLANLRGKSREFIQKFVDVSHLGLSVRLSKHEGIRDFALTADAKGTFHALWMEVGADGNYALMSRTIDVNSATGATDSLLAKTWAPPKCGEDTLHLRPDRPNAMPSRDLTDQTDVSSSLNLQVDHFEYSTESHVVTVRVTLINNGQGNLHGPLSLYGVGLHSDFGIASALNANGIKQGQPFWDLATVIPADGLPPKASSKPIELQFKIERFHPAPTGDAVAMQLRVFADKPTQ